MSVRILPKRSVVAGVVPVLTDLATGELAVNAADGILYLRKVDDTIIAVNSGLSQTRKLTVDFGTDQNFSEYFQAPVNDARLGMDVMVRLSGNVPDGHMDEMELEPLEVYGRIVANGYVEFCVTPVSDNVTFSGKRTLLYSMG